MVFVLLLTIPTKMIFVTSGTQLPFDRFIRTVDEVAAAFPEKQFLVQAINIRHKVTSPNIQLASYLSPVEFSEAVSTAELMISHAGIGSILSSAESGRPLIVFPRMGKLKEHRNNHQVATCEAMQKKFPLNVANNATELKQLLEVFFEGDLALLPRIPRYATNDLLVSLKEFVEEESETSWGYGRMLRSFTAK
jgi:UDP-N-acetylglucosamine transferase subunit ALG13